VAIEGEHELARELAEVARALIGAGDVQETLERMVTLAVATIEGCDHAGISLVINGRIDTPAESDPTPEIIDMIQNSTGEGPCVDAIRQHEVFETGDLSQEQRWNRFSTEVVEQTGVRSVLAMRLFIEQDTMGALNLYAKAPDAFDDDDRSVASIFAAHAAVALQSAQQQEQLIAAIETRDVIGQAKGIIMTRTGVDEAQAFEVLRGASSRTNRKLREVARRLIEQDQQRQTHQA